MWAIVGFPAHIVTLMIVGTRENRFATGSISFAFGELYTCAVKGSWVVIRFQPLNRSVPCRSLAAVIESDDQVVSGAGCVGAEAGLQLNRRIHLAHRLAANPGSDVRGWRCIHTTPNDGAVHEDVKQRIIRGRPTEIDHLDSYGRAGIVCDLPLGDVARG